jgi:hypothetical protein
LEELSNGKGKLAEASEDGQRPRRAVEPMMMMMIIIFLSQTDMSALMHATTGHGYR